MELSSDKLYNIKNNDRVIVCERGGLCPAPTPENTSRYSWHTSYQRQLEDMYRITQNVVNMRYPTNKIKWDDNSKFNNFSRLMYHCSSKYISPHLEEPDYMLWDIKPISKNPEGVWKKV